MNTQKQIALIVALFFILVGGCAAYTVVDLPVRAVDQTRWHKDQSIERGALLFANNCRTCHGIKGEGGVGLPLNIEKFQDQDPLVLKNNRALLTRTLQCGRAGSRMPAWLNTNGGSLNQVQIDHLVNLITAPVDESHKDEDGNPTSKGWLEAVEFAENLNHEAIVVVGGDTLGTIAKDHQVGIAELRAINGNIEPNQVLAHGTKVQLPASKGRPQGHVYQVNKDKETLARIAESQAVGALILADANGIAYTFSEKTGRIALKDGEKNRVSGLIPGVTLAIPQGAGYTVKAGDTLASIATRHGLSQSDIEKLNPNAPKTADGKALDAERKLKLPANAVAVVQAGQTYAIIASQHGLKAEDLAKANGLAVVPAEIGAGQQVKLPADTKYTIQAGDTLASVAKAHGISEGDLATLNALKAGEYISTLVVLAMPKIDKYVVGGQNLDDIAKTFSNVTAKSLAEAQEPKAAANSIYAVGSNLKLPADAWGSAPPDAINGGTACIQYAVPDDTFAGISGTAFIPTKPAAVTGTVLIEGNASDWTVTADGVKQPPNRGVVLVTKGTSIAFKNVAGLHTITRRVGLEKTGAKTVDVPDFKGTDTKDLAFNDVGEFSILCDIHPSMFAYVYVQ